MSWHSPLRAAILCALCFSSLIQSSFSQDAAGEPAADEEKIRPMVRLICVTTLAEDQSIVLATKDKEDKWVELGKTDIRASFVTDPVPVRPGPVHLTIREGGTLKSIGQFQYPAGAKLALVIMMADQEKQIYKTNVTNPEEIRFRKGSILILNFSQQTAVVMLGSKKVTVNGGQKQVAEPALDETGMYRKLVAYIDADKKPVPCYDRFISGSPDSRDMLFLFPDATNGLRVFSLPVVGE
jgi:hypothetical protein